MGKVKAGKKKKLEGRKGSAEAELLVFDYDSVALEAGASMERWLQQLEPGADRELAVINHMMALSFELGSFTQMLTKDSSKMEKHKWKQAIEAAQAQGREHVARHDAQAAAGEGISTGNA